MTAGAPTSCSACGRSNTLVDGICSHCGFASGEQNRCPHCGAVARIEPHGDGSSLTWVCAVCGGPRTPGGLGGDKAKEPLREAKRFRARATRSRAASWVLALMAAFTTLVLVAAWPAALALKLVLLALAMTPAAFAMRARGRAGDAAGKADEAMERAWLAAAEDVASRVKGGVTPSELAKRLKIDPERADKLLTQLAVHDRTRIDVGDDAEVRYSVAPEDRDVAKVRVGDVPEEEIRWRRRSTRRWRSASAKARRRRRPSSDRPGEEEEDDDVESDKGDEGAIEGDSPREGVVRRRRSLTNVGGAVDRGGDERISERLAHAIDVSPTAEADAPDRAHVHGFHAYPARAHPVTARRLVEAFAPARGVVLDPFCGSGTVLVEAMLAGRDAIGTDLNPLAVMLARAKTHPRKAAALEALVQSARDVAAFADARRKAKTGASRRLPQEDVSLYAPHVLLELDGIRAGIEKAPPEARPNLNLVLSSILVKLSAKRGDTSDEPLEKRVSAGYPARLFVRKTEELVRRFEEFASLLPADGKGPRARVLLDDASTLSKIEDASVDCVVTSPPYVATYDYLAHHDLRIRWLGLDPRRLAKAEIGARRRYERLAPRDARAAWERELAAFLGAIARVTKRGGAVVLLIADSATARGPRGEPPEAIRAEEVVEAVSARGKKLEAVARASQARPHFHGPTSVVFRERMRAEHVLYLRRV